MDVINGCHRYLHYIALGAKEDSNLGIRKMLLVLDANTRISTKRLNGIIGSSG